MSHIFTNPVESMGRWGGPSGQAMLQRAQLVPASTSTRYLKRRWASPRGMPPVVDDSAQQRDKCPTASAAIAPRSDSWRRCIGICHRPVALTWDWQVSRGTSLLSD